MKQWLKEKGPGLALKVLLSALTPVTAFFLMQWIYAGEFQAFPFYVILANGICLAAFYYLAAAATGRLLLASLLTHMAAGLLGAANYFVASFRGNPILPWDLTALGTAAAVSGTYRFRLTWPMILALAVAAFVGAALWAGRKGRFLRIKSWQGRGVLLCLGILCARPLANPELLGEWGITTDVWDQQGAYESQGILASFLRNTSFMEVEKPEGYSDEAYRTLLGEAGKSRRSTEILTAALPKGKEAGEKLPHIIAIMNESWADFEDFGHIKLSESVMDEIGGLDGIFGHAYTSVFGAGTSASEFEFLTGHSMAFLPSGSIPYQQYILEPTDSLASLLKDQGYRCLAFHPGERDSWQRNQAYPLLGFEEFLCGDDMSVAAAKEHGYISDDSSFDQVISMFEAREPGERLFLFNVTIQNHGSYTDEDYPAEICLADEPGAYPMAEQYLTLEGKTQEAFLKLIRYFRQQKEPVLVVMFGDHQPALEQEFLDQAYGVLQEDMTMEEYMGKFRVPYVIWANYELPKPEAMGLNPEITSLNYLGQYVLECAGIPLDDYRQYLKEVSRQIPALTFAGYVDPQGEAYSHLETNEYTGLIEEYQTVQYGKLFGGTD